MSDPTSFVGGILSKLPTLSKPKSPAVAAILGFLFGGVGLGLYFWSLLDFAICILVVVILAAVLHTPSTVLIGAAFAGIYGALRALDSNKRRDEAVIEQAKKLDPQRPDQ